MFAFLHFKSLNLLIPRYLGRIITAKKCSDFCDEIELKSEKYCEFELFLYEISLILQNTGIEKRTEWKCRDSKTKGLGNAGMKTQGFEIKGFEIHE